ncbi:hypothetical protein V6Z12_D11G364400 [Gossypium hirsutum]
MVVSFFPDIGIDVLIKKSLVKIDKHNKYLKMHDLLQEMGRKIVREKCVDEPEKRCRLWEEIDVHHILTKNTATEIIEGMIIDMVIRESSKMLNLSVHAFSNMKKLRLLKVFCLSKCDDLKFLSNELRLLDWKGCPLRSLPSSFQPDNLVALLLPYSHIQQLWKGNRPLCKLKMMNLEGSQNLIKTPDFTTASNLEVLILEGCTKLVDVHPSIAVLKSLKVLNLRDCKSLKSLPTKIGMESFETLILSGCSSLVRFPEIDGKMERLKTLDLSGCYRVENLSENLQQAKFLENLDLSETAITEPPSFIFQLRSSNLQQNLPSLFKLIRKGSTNSMAPMLPSLSSLSSLRELNLRDCSLCEGDIPSDISGLSSFKFLDLKGNNFISIPASIIQLSKLNYIRLSDCKMLKSLPELPTSTEDVWIDGCSSLEVVASPSKVCNLSGSAYITAINCYNLAENNNALTLLKKHLKAFAKSRKRFFVILPGNEIPEWFRQQRGGPLIEIPLPLNIQNDSQWIGVAVCCIFVNDSASGDKIFGCKANIHSKIAGQSGCKNSRTVHSSIIYLDQEYVQPIKKDHLFLNYWSRDELYPSSLEDKCNYSFKAKKCGVIIVYEKDLEENKELQCHSAQSSPNFEHILQHSAHNNESLGSTSHVKRKLESLEILILSSCSSLVRFPEIDGKMERLKTLDLSGCLRVENLSEN